MPIQMNNAKPDGFMLLGRLVTVFTACMCFDTIGGGSHACACPSTEAVDMSMDVDDRDDLDGDSDDLLCNSCSATMQEDCAKDDTSSSSSSSIIPIQRSFSEKLSNAYTNGMYCFIAKDEKYNSKTMQLMVPGEFISKEEEYYASRWNGHLSLVPMSASNAAVQQKSHRRRQSLVARGMATP